MWSFAAIRPRWRRRVVAAPPAPLGPPVPGWPLFAAQHGPPARLRLVGSASAPAGRRARVPASFEAFYTATRNDVLRAMLAQTADRDSAADATQHAFVRAFECWDQLEEHPNPRAWVIRVALNAHRSWWRTRRRELLGPDATDGPVSPARPCHWSDPEVIQALQALPTKQRAVIVLRFLYDLTPREVAHVLGIAEGTVWAHQHKAMGTLRAALPMRPVLEEGQP
jgi:RNA polymerase sigma-70 factor (ECF subfamily)